MIIKKSDIDIFASLECGQIFRFEKISEVEYVVFSQKEKCLIKEDKDTYILSTTNDDYFYKFFNLDVDYKQIISTIKKNAFFKNVIDDKTPKLRILKQDPIEMIFSFIISANNNIPRIKGIIKRLCENLGEKKDGFYAFPSVDVLSKQSEDFYKNIGLGYRAPYILNTAIKIKQGFDVNEIYKLDSESARKKLMMLDGVGPKVCDCILLFGYNKYDVFPVDTWIKKVYLDLYKKEETVEKMRKDFIRDFGEYSGIAQQFLFYSKRGK